MMEINSKAIKVLKRKRLLAWICVFLTTIFIVAPVVFKTMHWPGGNLLVILVPIPMALLLVGINKLVASDSYTLESIGTECDVRVDYRVRYAINSVIRMKRWVAWAMISVPGVALVIYIVKQLFFNHDEGYAFMAIFGVLLLSAILFFCGVYTLRTSKSVALSMKRNSQADFEQAMKKWYKRCVWFFWTFIVLAIVLIITIIFLLSNA